MNTLDPRDRMTTWQRIKLYVFNHATWVEIDFNLEGVDYAKSRMDFHETMREFYIGLREKAVRWHKKRSHFSARIKRHTEGSMCAEKVRNDYIEKLQQIGSKL